MRRRSWNLWLDKRQRIEWDENGVVCAVRGRIAPQCVINGLVQHTNCLLIQIMTIIKNCHCPIAGWDQVPCDTATKTIFVVFFVFQVCEFVDGICHLRRSAVTGYIHITCITQHMVPSRRINDSIHECTQHLSLRPAIITLLSIRIPENTNDCSSHSPPLPPLHGKLEIAWRNEEAAAAANWAL